MIILRKKFIKVLIELNSHIRPINSFKNLYIYNYYLYYRSNYVILNLFLNYNNFNYFTSLFKNLILNNCKLFFISNNLSCSKFIFYFSKKIKQYCYVGKWYPGILTNLKILFPNKFFDHTNKGSLNYLKILNDRKENVNLSLFRTNTLDLIKEVDMFFLIGSKNNFLDYRFVREILKHKLPIMGLFDHTFNVEYSLYFLIINVKKLLNIYFCFYLLIKVYLKFKNQYYLSKFKKNYRMRRQKNIKIKKSFILHKKRFYKL